MNIRHLVLILLFPIAVLTSCHHPQEADEENPAVKLAADLRNVSRLSLVEMSVNKVGTITDSGATGFAALLNMLKIGDRIGVYSYHTYLEAYIDLTALTPDDVKVDMKNKVVKLTLPQVQVRLSGRDATVTEEHYRVTGMRSSISPSERAKLKELMNNAVRVEIKENDDYGNLLIDTARRKATGYLSALLKTMGYESDITFRK